MSAGTIAAGSPSTAEAGAEILRRGGNAVDAAVAAIFAAFHAEPLLASAAGGGVMLAGGPARGYQALEFVPRMPGLGLPHRPDLDFGPITVDFGATTQDFHVGRGAAAVPMGLNGLHEAHRRWGRLPLSSVIEPAVRLCRDGMIISEAGGGFIAILEMIWRMTPESARLYSDATGRRLVAGDRLLNRDFADVMERLAAEGPDPFRDGDIADRVVETFGPERGGLLTAADLTAAEPRTLEPLRLPVMGGELITMPPPTSGGVLIALGMAALASQSAQGLTWGDENHLRRVVDAQLLTLQVRRERVGEGGPDPAVVRSIFASDGLEEILTRMGRVSPSLATTARPARGCTTHVSVLDEEGGAAAITVSNGEGCGTVIPGTGMHMNNFLGEEDVNPGGFHTQPAGETLASMMAPTIFVRDGRPELVLGSGGSNRLRTAILQVAFNRLGLRQDLPTAVAAARVHLEPDRFFAELPGLRESRLRELAAPFASHDLFTDRNLFFGGVHAVARESDGTLTGAGDPRRGGAAVTVDA